MYIKASILNSEGHRETTKYMNSLKVWANLVHTCLHALDLGKDAQFFFIFLKESMTPKSLKACLIVAFGFIFSVPKFIKFTKFD